jgi:hypothetical protein
MAAPTRDSRSSLALFAFTGFLLLAAPFAGATTLFTSLPADPGGGETYTVSALSQFGMQFSPTVSGPATGVDVSFDFNSGSTAIVDATLYTDNAGLPGTSLGSATLDVSGVGNNSTPDVITGEFATPPSLTVGDNYWLGLSTPSGDIGVVDSAASSNDTQAFTSSDVWSSFGARQIGGFQVDSTPEPGGLAMLGAGACTALTILRRRARR